MPDLSFNDLIPSSQNIPKTAAAATGGGMSFDDLIPASKPGTMDYYNKFAGGGTTQAPQDNGQSRSFALKSQPTPDAPGFVGGLVQEIEGKQDPAYAGLASVYSQFPDVLSHPTATAALLGASDPQMADIVQKQLGDKFIKRLTDANGYNVFVTRGANGKEQMGYLNRPGIDSEDLWRGLYGAAPYVAGGLGFGAVAKKLGIGTLGATILQALGATGTSVGGDILQEQLGSEQGIEAPKAITSGVAAGVAEPLSQVGSALWRRFIAEPRYFNRGTGELTALGHQEATRLGLDPSSMTRGVKQQFAKTFAANPADTNTLINSATDAEFAIPSTLGQRTKDPEQLMLEKNLRYGHQGLEAKTIMQGLDQDQADAVLKAAKQTIPSRLSGMNFPGPTNAKPGDYGANVVANLSDAFRTAKSGERAAWDQVRDITPSGDAVQFLGPNIRDSLGELASIYSPENTPVAFRMGQMLRDFASGHAPSNELQQAFGLPTNQGVDAMRKALGLMSRGAETPTDKAAASAIYEGYNNWVRQAAQQGALSGSIDDVIKMRAASDITKELKAIFQPRQGTKLTPGGKLLEAIQANADTPERVVSSLFSSAKGDIKSGAIEAIDLMKKGFERYLHPAQATAAWNNIRLAHWSRLVEGANGEMLGYQAMKENIKTALNKQETLIQKLYSPGEIAQIKRFLSQLEKITYKDPNPSGTASGVGVMARQFASSLIDSLPFARTAIEYLGLPERHAAAVAKKAVAQTPVPPSLPRYANALMAGSAQPYARNEMGN